MAVDISVVIPTYRENPEDLEQNIGYMKEQTAFKEKRMEIIISDYYEYIVKPEEDRFAWAKGQRGLRIVHSDRKGIAYQRHFGIMNSRGRVIVNFDADGYLAPDDAVHRLTAPILEGRAHITCCDNIFDIRELKPEQVESINFIIDFLNLLSSGQRNPFLPAVIEAGMTFSKEAYLFVGGFRDIRQYEGAFLGGLILNAYTPAFKLHIPGVQAVTSPRRALAAVKYGLLNTYANYVSQNFR